MKLTEKLNLLRDDLTSSTRDLGNSLASNLVKKDFGLGDLLTVDLSRNLGTVTGIAIPGVVGYFLNGPEGAMNCYALLPYSSAPLLIGASVDYSLRKPTLSSIKNNLEEHKI